MRFNIPIPAATFLQIASICSSQLSVSSSVTPRQGIECILGIGWPFNTTGVSSLILLRLCFDATYINLVLEE